MSREERRQYQRMMKGADRAPGLPPAARQKLDRAKAKRSSRPASRPGTSGRRVWVWTAVAAVLIGLLAFSLQWPNMPFALYVGMAAGLVTILVVAGVRMLVRRAGTVGSDH